MRQRMFPVGASVLVRVKNDIDSAYVAGVVHTVGYLTGTYRIKVGRKLHHVSLTQVRQPSHEES